MQNRVDSMHASRTIPSVKFLEFTRMFSYHGNKCISAFFEGEDSKYYTVRVNNIRPDLDWHSINCGGKSNVIVLRKMIRDNSAYSDAYCMFFVDADFDDNLDISSMHDVYITPCYSIENLYMDEQCVRNLLNSEFNLSTFCDESECYEYAVSEYKRLLAEFNSIMLDFNIWVKIYIEKQAAGVPVELNIKNIELSDLVSFRDFKLERVYGDEISIFPKAYKINITDYSRVKGELEIDKATSIFRGKQLIDFLRIFLEEIKRDRQKREGRVIFKQKGVVKIMLTKNNILSECSQYAITPQCLISFLNSQPISYSKKL
ncbi:DUF4435 domain-containing protein [Serratia fonticola]|uniref:DUF4435 domain-containing protein n=1 Tax=Serratia fonticola TaxID=47917 RepID=A0ABY9PNI9_SERFO|nr:DUF4435 domain-containing protein [Serratia fonticola]WMT13681.1 DUF4435 domain-containing protein [Serratia fonticola]